MEKIIYIKDSRGWKEKRVERTCLSCKKTFLARFGDKKIGAGKYCSRSCKGMGWDTEGKNNPRWNNGVTHAEQGYVLIRCKNHPNADKHGYVREHRLIMEKQLGRYLLSTEDVHHINGNKQDNRVENLELVQNRSEHIKIEHRKGTYRKHLLILNSI